MDEICRLVELANQRLKSGGVGLTLEMQGKGNWLHLRGTFPPKPNDKRTRPYQTRVALKLRAMNRESVKQAELIAREIGLDLNLGRFDWRKFSDFEDDPQSRKIADWIQEYEKQFWSQRERNSSSENTWQRGYLSCLKRLPLDQPLSTQVLVDWIIENSEPKTRRRGHYVTCARGLSELADLPVEAFKKIAGGAGTKPCNPRLLPADEQIAELREGIADPGWQWIFGVMAAYGLRNHEVFFLDLENFPVVRVRKEAKTQERPVKPLYPEWAEQWHLGELIYPRKITLLPGMGNAQLGAKVTTWFERRMPFLPYNLRHCYSRRCTLFGIEPSTAARLMGHTLRIHEVVYKAWVGEKVYLDAVDRVLSRSDRPLPP